MKLCIPPVLPGRKIRGPGRLVATAVIAVVVVATALAGAAPASAAAKDLERPTRDKDLPIKPTKIADLFIADSYGKANEGIEVDWFCRPGGKKDEGKKEDEGKVCDSDSPTAFNKLSAKLNGVPQGQQPELLRVGKARDDCVAGDKASESRCATGVPPKKGDCKNDPSASPFCVFKALKKGGMKLGVIVGSREKGLSSLIRG